MSRLGLPTNRNGSRNALHPNATDAHPAFQPDTRAMLAAAYAASATGGVIIDSMP